MGFSQSEAEQKLSPKSPRGADSLCDFSKSRNLTPSDCGIRLFDKICTATPPDPQLVLLSFLYNTVLNYD